MHTWFSWPGQWRPLPIICKKRVTRTVPVNMNVSAIKFSQPALLTASMKWDHLLPCIMLQGNWIKMCSEGSDKSRRLSATQVKYVKPLWCKGSIRHRITALCVRRSMWERSCVNVPALLIQQITPSPWGHSLTVIYSHGSTASASNWKEEIAQLDLLPFSSLYLSCSVRISTV